MLKRTTGLALVLTALGALAAGCYGPDRQPGDDASRADEGPRGGKPLTDPLDTRDPKSLSGSGTTDSNERVPDESGRLDGPSDEVVAPEQ